MAYLYTPAFVAFCSGASVDEIAAEFKIPIESLKAKIRQENWRGLIKRMAGRITADRIPGEDALARCEANRAKNFEMASKLREHLIEVVGALRAGTLRIKKVLHRKGETIEFLAEPGPADWVSIAAYARTIADMTYRALGDMVANGGYKADVNQGNQTPESALTIVLPEVVARPRSQRGLEVEAGSLEQGEENTEPPLLLPPAVGGDGLG